MRFTVRIGARRRKGPRPKTFLTAAGSLAVAQLRAALADFTVREIATSVGVTEGTIRHVATGRRDASEALRRRLHESGYVDRSAWETPLGEPDAPGARSARPRRDHETGARSRPKKIQGKKSRAAALTQAEGDVEVPRIAVVRILREVLLGDAIRPSRGGDAGERSDGMGPVRRTWPAVERALVDALKRHPEAAADLRAALTCLDEENPR